MLSNVWYDRLKFVALILLPAVGALYFGLAEIWHLPKAKEVVGTITVLETFLGVLLKLSTTKYDNSLKKYGGAIVMTEDEVSKAYSLELFKDIEAYRPGDSVLFKFIEK